MKVLKEHINKLSYFTIFLISIIVIIIMSSLSKYNSFWGDDIYFSIYGIYENIFSCLVEKGYLQTHGGSYIGLFLNKFLSFGLPNLLHIHPADFVRDYLGIIKGLITVITLLSISLISTINNKTKKFFSLVYLFVSIYFFICVYQSSTWVPFINYNFYRYFFSFFFLSLFLKNTYESLLSENIKNSKKSIIITSICGFILGTSIEISFFTAITLFFLILFYNFILKFIQKNQFRFNLGANFYIPNLFLLIATSLFTSSSGFKEVAETRGMSELSFNLSEFLPLYVKTCFLNEWFYWLIFIICIIFAYKISKNNNEPNQILLPIFYLISLLTVMFSLILCGKTCTMANHQNLTFFVEHINIIFLYKMSLLFPILLLLSYICCAEIKYKKIFITCILILITCYEFICVLNKDNISYWKDRANFFIKIQKQLYVSEKIAKFYLLRNEKPIIYHKEDTWFLCNSEIECMSGDNLDSFGAYFFKIHNLEQIKEFGYCRQENSIENFYNLGGVFTKQELENLKFKNLLNNEFIFENKFDDIMTVEEIYQQLEI